MSYARFAEEGGDLPPHCWALAGQCYRNAFSALTATHTHYDQALIITGESGVIIIVVVVGIVGIVVMVLWCSYVNYYHHHCYYCCRYSSSSSTFAATTRVLCCAIHAGSL